MLAQQQLFEMIQFARRAIARHWKKGAAVGGAACVVALIGTLLMPRSYYSEARLFVRFGRENQVDLTAAGGQMAALSESRESEMTSLIEILKSRAILDRVVREIGPGYILDGSKSAPEASVATPGAPPSRAHQQAVRTLEKSIVISAPRKSSIITVAGKARSPEIAQQIVARLVAVYLEEHVRVHRTPGSFEFFVEQARVSKAAWQTAADRLRDAKNKLNIVTIDGKRRELETLLAEAAGKLLVNQADLTTCAGRIAALKAQIAALPATTVTHDVASTSTAFDLLEAKEKELAAKMTDSHPKLAAVRQQVADLRGILKAQPAERRAQTDALNPARQSLELSLLTEESQQSALRAKESSLAAQQQELRGALAALNGSPLEIEQLQQQVTLAETNHRDYVQRLEQARINRSLDDERMSSLSLVQPASYVAQANGPQRTYVLAAGLLLSAASSLGTVLLAAWLNPVVTTAEQLTALINVPVVGVIPPRMIRAA